jgi:hypothetical protein
MRSVCKSKAQSQYNDFRLGGRLVPRRCLILGRCPSGQWEQTVNLSARAYAGSNPALPTIQATRKGCSPLKLDSLRLAFSVGFFIAGGRLASGQGS